MSLNLAPTDSRLIDMESAAIYESRAIVTAHNVDHASAYGDAYNDADRRNRALDSALTDALLAGAMRSGRRSWLDAA